MKTCFLTSYFPSNFTKDFEREFKKHSNKNNRFVFVASSFDNYIKNDKYFNDIINLFNKIDVNYQEIKVIDYRVSKDETKDYIMNADVIWLSGGDTLKQIGYFNEYDLREVFKYYQGIIIGMSAGSINMADRVILPKDEEDNVPELSIYQGLGLVFINIEPHLDFNRKNHIEDIKEASKISTIYGLYDDSFIIVKDDNLEFFGDYYKF